MKGHMLAAKCIDYITESGPQRDKGREGDFGLDQVGLLVGGTIS